MREEQYSALPEAMGIGCPRAVWKDCPQGRGHSQTPHQPLGNQRQPPTSAGLLRPEQPSTGKGSAGHRDPRGTHSHSTRGELGTSGMRMPPPQASPGGATPSSEVADRRDGQSRHGAPGGRAQTQDPVLAGHSHQLSCLRPSLLTAMWGRSGARGPPGWISCSGSAVLRVEAGLPEQ